MSTLNKPCRTCPATEPYLMPRPLAWLALLLSSFWLLLIGCLALLLAAGLVWLMLF